MHTRDGWFDRSDSMPNRFEHFAVYCAGSDAVFDRVDNDLAKVGSGRFCSLDHLLSRCGFQHVRFGNIGDDAHAKDSHVVLAGDGDFGNG